MRRPVAVPTLGRLSVHNALAAAAVGLAAGLDRRDRRRPGRRLVGAASGRARPSRRRDPRRRHLQRLAAVDDRGPRPAGRAARSARSPCSARCSSSAKARSKAIAAVGEAAARTVDRLVVVGRRRGRDRRGCRRRPGSIRRRIVRVRDAEAALDALPPRLRDGDVVLRQGVARDRARSRRRRPSTRVRIRDPPDDGRADPGPAARVRPRSSS